MCARETISSAQRQNAQNRIQAQNSILCCAGTAPSSRNHEKSGRWWATAGLRYCRSQMRLIKSIGCDKARISTGHAGSGISVRTDGRIYYRRVTVFLGKSIAGPLSDLSCTLVVPTVVEFAAFFDDQRAHTVRSSLRAAMAACPAVSHPPGQNIEPLTTHASLASFLCGRKIFRARGPLAR